MMWKEEWKGRNVVLFKHPHWPEAIVVGPGDDEFHVSVQIRKEKPFDWDPWQLFDVSSQWRLAQYHKGRGHRKGGKLRDEFWYVERECGSDRYFYGERIVDKEREHVDVSAHCLACAKTEVLLKYGGKVDIRGWHKQGICGTFLKAASIAGEEDIDVKSDSTD